MTTKFSTIALLISILIMSASCNNNTNDNISENTTDDIQSQIEETTLSERYSIKEDLPEVTYDGYVFRVLTRDDSTHSATPHQNEVMVESLNGEIENDAIYDRNRAIEERFNIKIEMITVSENPESTLTDHFTRSVLANDDTFDLALPHMILGGGIASTGIMYNWHEMPYVDFDKPWWNKIAVDEFTINDKLYLTSSDYIKSSIYSTWVMFYNYVIGEKHNIPNLIDILYLL